MSTKWKQRNNEANTNTCMSTAIKNYTASGNPNLPLQFHLFNKKRTPVILNNVLYLQSSLKLQHKLAKF